MIDLYIPLPLTSLFSPRIFLLIIIIFFHIGFNEESFKVYQQKIRKYNFEHQMSLRSDEQFENSPSHNNDNYLKIHQTLNFYLPHEFGGCGAPFFEKQKYDLFNIFTDEMDLAIIKPRWTVKHDFRVELPRNSKLDQLVEEIDD